MKIIKDGDIPNKVKFKCDKCNCVFVAGAGEFEFVDKYDKPITGEWIKYKYDLYESEYVKRNINK